MPIIVLDGPDKEFLSAVVDSIVTLWQGPTYVHHMSPAMQVTEYVAAIQYDIQLLHLEDRERLLCIWQGSWLTGDYDVSWKREIHCGRAVQAIGIRAWVQPGSGEDSRRQLTKMFLWNDYDIANPSAVAFHLIQTAMVYPFRYWPPLYGGKPDSPVVFVSGTTRGVANSQRGTFRVPPFYRECALDWLEYMIPGAILSAGWTQAMAIPVSAIRDAKLFVAFTEPAAEWVRTHVGSTNVVCVPAPEVMKPKPYPEKTLVRARRNQTYAAPTAKKMAKINELIAEGYRR